jgi:predicted DNA-binding mobile mystery protein A
MTYTYQTFSPKLRQVDQLVEPWRALVRREPPRGGWLRLVRNALGMSTRQAAGRLHVSQPRVVNLEKAEAEGTVTLNSMRQAAEALGCEFVYAVVPSKPIREVREERAAYQAAKKLKPVMHSMALEQQTPTQAAQDDLLKQQINDLLTGRPSRLWDDKP